MKKRVQSEMADDIPESEDLYFASTKVSCLSKIITRKN